jgi:hypothetical protein
MKEIDELRGGMLALTVLLHAVVEAHPSPGILLIAFSRPVRTGDGNASGDQQR